MKNNSILFLFTLVILSSCDVDDNFVNLKSSLNSENTFVGTYEGKHLYINLNLSKRLSKDLLLKADFNTDDIVKYTNGEKDYNQALEYSEDGGTSWETEPDKKQIRFKKGVRQLKVRISTKEDNLLEIDESFALQFMPIDNDGIELINEIDKITCVIQDNDNTPNVRDPSILMNFVVNNRTGTYEVQAINTTVTKRIQKEIIDEKHKKILEDVLAVTKLTPVKLVEFNLLYSESGLGGYVYAVSAANDEWVMGLNSYFAFTHREDNSISPQAYNNDGGYGSILAHESGHLLTLNYTNEFNLPSQSSFPCSTFADRQNEELTGCSKPDSYMNVFNEAFYVTPTTNEPTHVSNYARTNELEDMAESFSFYVTQTDIPENSPSSSGALAKVNWIKSRNKLAALKTKIRDIVKVDFLSGNSAIAAYNVDKDGNRISCLSHRQLLDMDK